MTATILSRTPSPVRSPGFAVVLGIIAVSFGGGALLHAGVPLGVLHEPVIGGAAVVEGVCAIGFALATASVLGGRRRTGRVVRYAHLVGIAGVLLGILALDLDLGPRTESNDLYHLAVLATMLLTLRWYERRIEPR